MCVLNLIKKNIFRIPLYINLLTTVWSFGDRLIKHRTKDLSVSFARSEEHNSFIKSGIDVA